MNTLSQASAKLNGVLILSAISNSNVQYEYDNMIYLIIIYIIYIYYMVLVLWYNIFFDIILYIILLDSIYYIVYIK